MSEELERYKKALHVAVKRLEVRDWTGGVSGERCEDTLAQIDAILNPPPKMEPFVVERFLLCYPDGTVDERIFTREDIQGLDCKGGTVRLAAWELYRPARRPVIREYEVAAKVVKGCPPYGDGSCLRVGGGVLFADHPECHGKAGVLIFRTAE